MPGARRVEPPVIVMAADALAHGGGVRHTYADVRRADERRLAEDAGANTGPIPIGSLWSRAVDLEGFDVYVPRRPRR